MGIWSALWCSCSSVFSAIEKDLSLPLHAAIFACLTTTFYTTVVQHDWQGLEVYNFHLPCTKSAPLGEDVSWAKQNGLSDPLSALENHFGVKDPPANGALFAYHHNNSHRPLTKKKFLSVLASTATHVGIKLLQGHGIRIGSTLEYLLWNIPFDVIKVKGHWASDTFLIYICQHAQILTPFIQAQPTIQKAFLHYTLPPMY
ncbi:hypothetical protein PAXRUDRAFT_21746 [Paxillus rubicundulus Ve08.2h10]|uniref:Uncharacterized protein n=1 Tax=Paxillus rubicundulus Ve08.2h10 TaxID=930991 RepID=A0A0D0CPA7_9AGAM|nr:hypothetical protein PAXRUDRAFT_21746 [Paxillus rubicundulus Ve08.2h10]